MIDLIEHRIVEKDCENGFILDGFPRNLVQGKRNRTITGKCLLLERLIGR